MNNLTIAAQLYTVRDFAKTPEDIEKTLKRVKDIGYNAVQVSGIGPIEPLRLKEIVDCLDLKICATHTSAERLKNDLEGVINDHRLWGCEYIGIGGMPPEYKINKEGYQRFAAEFSEIGRSLLKEGFKFVYHNHNFEFERFDETTGIEILLKESDTKAFGFLMDTFWVQAGGANPVEWIKKVEGRMGVVHLKDMAIRNNQQVFAEIGQGNMDWEGIIKTCSETGVKWYVVEQDVCPGDPFESLEISFKYLQKFAER